MASKSKRARVTPTYDHIKIFKFLAVTIFLIKIIISINIVGFEIKLSGDPFYLNSIWLGADGENYLTGYIALTKDGFFSNANILNYWPAGYPLVIYTLSFLSGAWALKLLAILQSFVFSFSALIFAKQLYRTRIKKYALLVLILILVNPTLSLSSLTVGYESLASSGLILSIAIVIKDLVEKNNENFFKLLVLNSLIVSFVSFIQPRFLASGFSIIMFWLFYKKGIKLGVLFLLPSLAITLILPGSLILRNSNAVGLNVISTNLGTTMNIGAGNGATGGYLSKGDYGVPCQTSGTESEQDNQKVLCVLNWYVENPIKATKLFYNKSIFFWSPWIGPLENGTMGRNPWLKVNPIKNFMNTPERVNLIYGDLGKIFSWLWLLSTLGILIYGAKILWGLNQIERLIAIICMSVIGANWIISLLTIGDHRFRIPVMGFILFLQAVGLKTLFRGGKPAMVDGPTLR